MARLDGRVAIVTGAGRGIGRAIALHMAGEGARVLVNDLGGDVDGAGAALDAFGQVDVLVNNAGILRDRTLFNMEEEDWDSVLAVHLRGHYCCTRPLVRYIRESKRAGCRIINFSSVSGLYGNFGQSNYGAAKAGIAGFSRVVALEVAKYGATCNTISPGAATRMTIDLMKARGRDPEQARRGPEEIAPVVTWLASPDAQHVTGQIFHVAGGLVGIMQQPAVIRSFQSSELWSLEELDRRMPMLLDAKQAHDERVKESGEPEAV
jgi:NAD(P)-dependent dehydrogenase (short-subunit alcohol dehydrogenase family)